MTFFLLLSPTLLPSLTSVGLADSFVTSSQGSLELRALHDALPADGQSQTGVVVRTLDAKEQPVEGAPVSLETTLGTLSPTEVVTNDLGYAVATLQSSEKVGEATITVKWEELKASTTVLFYSGEGLETLVADPHLFVEWSPNEEQPAQKAYGKAGGEVVGQIKIKIADGGSGVAWPLSVVIHEDAGHMVDVDLYSFSRKVTGSGNPYGLPAGVTVWTCPSPGAYSSNDGGRHNGTHTLTFWFYRFPSGADHESIPLPMRNLTLQPVEDAEHPKLLQWDPEDPSRTKTKMAGWFTGWGVELTLPDRSLTVAVLTGAAVKPYRDREGAVFVNLPMNHPKMAITMSCKQKQGVTVGFKVYRLDRTDDTPRWLRSRCPLSGRMRWTPSKWNGTARPARGRGPRRACTPETCGPRRFP